MDNLEQILNGFLEFIQSLPGMMGDLWKWIGDNGAAIGVVFGFLTLLFGLPRIKRWLKGEPKPPDPVQECPAPTATVRLC